MSSSCENELIRRLQASNGFTISLDETTDITALAVLPVVRYIQEVVA